MAASVMAIQSCTIPLMKASLWSEGSCLPGFDRPESLMDVASGPPDVSWIDPLLRRRLSPMARGILHCAQRIAPEPGDMRTLFASRHGEVARTIPFLEDLAQAREPSPTLFSMNVHNAVAGIWSILKANHGASTSICAGPETFGWGLLAAQAARLAVPDAPVLYAFGEDRLPELFQGDDPVEESLHAIALLIGEPAALTLTVQWDSEYQNHPSPLPQSLHFAGQIATGVQQSIWSSGKGGWSWHVA